MTPGLQQHIDLWLQKALNDLLSAQRLIGIEPMILDSACFHCQQAIEKCLKAFLLYKGQDAPRTHDIDFLLNKCAHFDKVFATIDTLNINDFAVQIRYPDFALLPEPGEAKEYYRLAAEINQIVKDRIIF